MQKRNYHDKCYFFSMFRKKYSLTCPFLEFLSKLKYFARGKVAEFNFAVNPAAYVWIGRTLEIMRSHFESIFDLIPNSFMCYLNFISLVTDLSFFSSFFLN